MPPTHTSTFKVRFYECDAYGHVNNTNYLRYMQEAAFDASAAAGYDTQRYDEMGRSWHIHATDIEYLRPAKYGDVIEVKTWVADARRVTSRRVYELRDATTGEMLAQATSDWAFLDTVTQKPTLIPDDLVQALLGEANDRQNTREKFPIASPQPERAYRMRKRVQWREIDSAKHVNNAVYADWAQDCGVECVAHFNWSAQKMAEHGLAIIYRRMWIEYQQAALLDDDIEIAAWLSDVKRVTGMRHITVTRVTDGAVLARLNIYGVCANINTGMPARWPQELLEDFKPNIA